MLINSIEFIIFLGVLVLIYKIMPKKENVKALCDFIVNYRPY